MREVTNNSNSITTPRSKLHHLIVTVGVEKATSVPVRTVNTVAELEAINKQDARVVAKPFKT